MRSELTQLLTDMANLSQAIDYSHLDGIEKFLSKLEHYPQIKALESVGKIYSLSRSSRNIRPGMLDSIRHKQPKQVTEAIEEIKQYTYEINTEVRKLSDTLFPSEEEKAALIDIMKRLNRSNEILEEDVKKVDKTGQPWEIRKALWDEAYSKYFKTLSAVHQEILQWVPWIKNEPENQTIETHLKVMPDIVPMALKLEGSTDQKYGSACFFQIEETKTISLEFNNLLPKVRVAYKIRDGDLEEPKTEKTAEIIQRIEQPKVEKPPLIQIPKHQLLLEELEYLAEKELPAKLGLERPVSDVQDVMNDIKRNLTSFLFGRIAELKLDDLPLRDDNMLGHTKKINESLSGRSKADKLTPQESKILGEYSLELKSYIRERKKDVQEELAH